MIATPEACQVKHVVATVVAAASGLALQANWLTLGMMLPPRSSGLLGLPWGEVIAAVLGARPEGVTLEFKL